MQNGIADLKISASDFGWRAELSVVSTTKEEVELITVDVQIEKKPDLPISEVQELVLQQAIALLSSYTKAQMR